MTEKGMSLEQFAEKWKDIMEEPDLPQPLKFIADFVKRELEKEAEVQGKEEI
jgi:hypothetical protein